MPSNSDGRRNLPNSHTCSSFISLQLATPFEADSGYTRSAERANLVANPVADLEGKRAELIMALMRRRGVALGIAFCSAVHIFFVFQIRRGQSRAGSSKRKRAWGGCLPVKLNFEQS